MDVLLYLMYNCAGKQADIFGPVASLALRNVISLESRSCNFRTFSISIFNIKCCLCVRYSHCSCNWAYLFYISPVSVTIQTLL